MHSNMNVKFPNHVVLKDSTAYKAFYKYAACRREPQNIFLQVWIAVIDFLMRFIHSVRWFAVVWASTLFWKATYTTEFTMRCQIWRCFRISTRNITKLCIYLTKVKLILLLGLYPSPQLKVFSTSGELKRTTKQTVVHKHIHVHYVVWCFVTMGKVLIKTSYENTTKNWIFSNSAVNTSILPCKPHCKGFWILQLYSGTLFVVCLFSWRYNPLWLYFHSPVAGFSLLVFEVSWSHTTTRYSQ